VGLREMEILNSILAWSKTGVVKHLELPLPLLHLKVRKQFYWRADDGTAILLRLLDTFTSFTLSSQDLAVYVYLKASSDLDCEAQFRTFRGTRCYFPQSLATDYDS
jgi:hypothetical protein